MPLDLLWLAIPAYVVLQVVAMMRISGGSRIALIPVGPGFFRGWFTLTGGREAVSQNIDVKLSSDTDKVKLDAESVTGGLKNKASHNEH